MVSDLSQYFIDANKEPHYGGFCGEVKFDPSHTRNQGFKFYGEDILGNSVSLTHQASSTNDVTIGGVYLGVLKLAFQPSVLTVNRINTDYWTQAVICLYYEEYTGNPSPSENFSGKEGWESFEVGVYYVKECYFQGSYCYLTAYDGLCLFDKPVDSVIGTFWYIINKAVFEARNVNAVALYNAIDKDRLEEMPNTTRNYSAYYDNDIVTWRDVLYWVAQSIGGFFYMGRDGGLKIFCFKNNYAWKYSADATLDYTERVAGTSQISDYYANWDGVRIKDLVLEEDKTATYVAGHDTKLYELGANPFYQNLSSANKSSFLNDLRDVVADSIQIRPFKVQLRSAPIYDLGDKLAFTRGDWAPWQVGYQPAESCVLYWNYSRGVLTLQAFGAKRGTVYNYNAGGGSGSSSGGGGGGTGGGGSKMDYFYFVNQAEVELDQVDDMVELGSIDFYSEQDTSIELIAQLNYEKQFNSVSAVEYYWELDGVAEFAAKSGSGANTVYYSIETLSWLKQIGTPGLHTMKLKAKLVSPTTTTDLMFYPGDIRIILKGQGLAQEQEWNGIISLSSDWLRIQPRTELVSIGELFTFSFPPVESEELLGSVQGIQAGAQLNQISGVFTLTIEPE